MSSTEPASLIDALAGIMAESGVPCEKVGNDILQSGIQGEQHGYIFYAVAQDAEIVTFVLSFEASIPEDRRVPLAEAMMHVNPNLPIGSFDIDLEFGKASYRVGMDVSAGELDARTVNSVIDRAVYYCDGFHDVFMKVAFEDVSPSDS